MLELTFPPRGPSGGVGNVNVAENGTTAAVVDPDSGGVNASGDMKEETTGWGNGDS